MRRHNPTLILAAACVAAGLGSLPALAGGVVTASRAPAPPLGPASAPLPVAAGHGYLDTSTDGPCLTDADRLLIRAELAASVADLQARGVLPAVPDKAAGVLLQWPLRAAAHVDDPGVHGISNFVDQDSAFPNQLLDYNCGARTYDQAGGYNHSGTDIFLWPFSWHKVDDDDVEIVAGAAGVIISKSDGNYDRNCSFGGGFWNAVYVRHADGSVAWYGHMKNGSTTAKAVGQAVAAGEYLGVVGSSGNSTGPHLHLELYDNLGNLVDPWAGACNSRNVDSWWAQQRPYYDSAINALHTHSALPAWQTCPQPAITNFQDQFTAGELVYVVAYYRDQRQGQVSNYEVLRPDGSVWQQWTGSLSSPAHYAASWWAWYMYLPADAATGMWTFRVSFEGQVATHRFAVGNVSAVPGAATAGFALAAPAPNPFNPSTTISYTLAGDGPVELTVHDLQGRKVATLQSGAQAAGGHRVTWDGRADDGRVLASGIYLVHLRQGTQAQSQRVVMLK